MTKKINLTIQDVKHIAKLANLNLTEEQLQKFASKLTLILEYVSKLQSLDTAGVPETSQVTGQENVFREDVVETERMLSQEEALSNAKKTYNGFFEVDAILVE